MFGPNSQSCEKDFFALAKSFKNRLDKYCEAFPPFNFRSLEPFELRIIQKFDYELIKIIGHNNRVKKNEIKNDYYNETEIIFRRNEIYNAIRYYAFSNNNVDSKKGFSFQIFILLSNIFSKAFTMIHRHKSIFYSIKLNNSPFLYGIFKKIYKNKNYKFICESLSKMPLFSFFSPIKLPHSFTKNELISQLKFLEYKESIIRMTEKINKISNLELKAKATEALSFASRKLNSFKGKKSSSELKKLFMKKMLNYISKAKEIIEYTNKYNIIFYNSYNNFPEADYQAVINSFKIERDIPEYIKSFNINQPHLTPIDQYLSIRLSLTIRLMINKANHQGRNTEIFIGSENQMFYFYTNIGYELIANLNTNSSLQYYLFAKKENPKLNKIIILGVGNETKLNHLLLQLKLGGIDLDKVIIRGNIENSFSENQLKLEAIINSLENEIDTVFIGNRSLILKEYAKMKYPNEMKKATNENESEKIAEKLLKEYHNLKTYKIGEGVFKFSSFEINVGNKSILIICFRMPNGNLAQIATEILITKGTNRLVMLGAGGSLSQLSSVGSYQLIKSASYNNNSILVSDLNVKEISIDLSEIPLLENASNITLDSPLLETRNWLMQVKNSKLTCVDVETYHIFKGIQNRQKLVKQIELLAGIFISDVVGERPLIEKIKSLNTWNHLPKFLNSCFEYIENQIKEELRNNRLKCVSFVNNNSNINNICIS